MSYNIQEYIGRLDQVLSELIPDASRTRLKSEIQAGNVSVDGKVVTKPSTNVDEASSISCTLSLEEKLLKLEPVAMDLDVIYEDKDLIVVNKPRGILVHPGDTGTEPTLVAGVLAHCKKLAKTDNPMRPGVVHRLDRHTEGLLVFAKTTKAFEGLKTQFQERTLVKKYYAMLKGNLPENEYHIETQMGRHRQQRHKQTSFSPVPGTEKQAISTIKIKNRYNTKTFCDIQIHTGRTHQIRVHCSELGYPVLGDTVYDPNCGKNYDGQLLQAYFLSFDHPSTEKKMTFELEPSKIFS